MMDYGDYEWWTECRSVHSTLSTQIPWANLHEIKLKFIQVTTTATTIAHRLPMSRIRIAICSSHSFCSVFFRSFYFISSHRKTIVARVMLEFSIYVRAGWRTTEMEFNVHEFACKRASSCLSPPTLLSSTHTQSLSLSSVPKHIRRANEINPK